MALRRARGVILRLVRRRGRAVALGAALVAPAAWIELSGAPVAWWLDGLAVLLGATGVALVWTGLTGPRPDWVDTTDNAETAERAEKP